MATKQAKDPFEEVDDSPTMQPFKTEEAAAAEASDDDLEIVIVEDGPTGGEGEGEPAPGEGEPAQGEPAPGEGEPAQGEGEPAPGEGEGEPLDEELQNDAEFKSFNAKIQKRIQREIRTRREAERAANLAVQHLQRMGPQYEATVARMQKAEEESFSLKRQNAQVLELAFGAQIETKTKELRAAREAQEYDSELKLQAELDELRFKRNQVTDILNSMPEKFEAPAAQAPAQQQQQQQQRPPLNPLAAKWVRDNAAWFNNPKFKAQREYVLRVVDPDLATTHDARSAEYYKELDKRLDDAFPGLRKRPAPRPNGQGQGAGTPASPVAGVGGTPRKAKTTISITKSDLDAMRMVGLDPTNKAHVQEFAKQKQLAQ
jgi:hypothetical protein